MRIVFIGTGQIGVPTLRALLNSEHEVVVVVTQPDKPVGREQSIEPPPIKKEIAKTRIQILQPARIRDQQAIQEIHGQILPRYFPEIPRLVCLNLHASLLPRWRGAAPIKAAIATGDCETGVTV